MARLTLSETSRGGVSPWQDTPRDVLIEIFLECLPTDPLRYQQPDTTVAPMLLCQVCSYWRYVALSTPQIWESLYHAINVVSPTMPTADLLKKGVRAKDVRFLRWWANNLRLKSPSLRLRVVWPLNIRKFEHSGQTFHENQAENEGGNEDNQSLFFETLFTSAKYLDLDPSYITILSDWTCVHPFSYPNLDTLVMRHHTCTASRPATVLRGDLTVPMNPAGTRPICQLHLESFRFYHWTSLSAFHWSHLTHATLLNINIALRIWHHLLRALTNLHTGTFHIAKLDPTELLDPLSASSASRTPLYPATLPRLHTLQISLPSHRTLTSQILLDVYLPSLRRLRLSSPALSLSSLNTILSSTPALTHLHLCGRIPFCWTSHSISIPPAHPQCHHHYTPQSACTPLTRLLPNLTYLLLDGSIQNNHMVLSWVSSVLSSPWLQLPRHPSISNRGVGGATGSPGTGITHLQLAISRPCDDDGDAMSAEQQYTLSLHDIHPAVAHGWVITNPFSMERSSHVLQKLRGIVESCEVDLDRVEIVIRGPDAPKLWSGNLLNEDQNPTFDVPGFS